MSGSDTTSERERLWSLFDGNPLASLSMSREKLTKFEKDSQNWCKEQERMAHEFLKQTEGRILEIEKKKASIDSEEQKSLEEQIKKKQAICLELEAQLAATRNTLNSFNAVSEEDVEKLTLEVIKLEAEKKEFKEQLLKRKESISKIFAYYHLLDCRIVHEPPDLFKVFFSLSDNSKWILLRSDDFDFWQILDSSLSPDQREYLAELLQETDDPMLIVERARKMCLT